MRQALEYPEPPKAPPPKGPPGGSYAREWRVLWQPLRLLAWAPALARAPSGAGASVLLVPGWKAPELCMEPLRWFLSLKGFDARPWGLGVNRGDVRGDSARLAERARALHAERGRPVGLVGWSLGGVVAREAARRCPEAVYAVVTYGTPAVGGPSFTRAAPAWGPNACVELAAATERLDQTQPISVPVGAVFSRQDEVVCWRAAVDRKSRRVTHYEVFSPHFAMGLDPAVWSVVCEQLAHHAPGA